MSARTLIAITLLISPFKSIANNGVNLGLSLGQSFENVASFETDIGYRNNSWLFTFGLDNSSVTDTEFTSQIAYTLNKSDDYSIDIGVGLEASNPVLSYGVHRKIFKQIDAELGIKTVFGTNNGNKQEGYLTIRYYLTGSDSNTGHISNSIKSNIPAKTVGVSVAEAVQPKLDYSLEVDVIESVSQPIVHIVVKDEWLLKLSRMYDVSLDKILLVNPDIANPNIIFPDQLIVIPEAIVK